MAALTDAWFPLRYHPEQNKLWRTRARFVAAACGRGSGKTELARRRVVRYLPVKRPHREAPLYFYALPTYNQARRVAWDKIKALVPDNWVVGEPHNSDMSIKTVFGSTLFLVGMDKPARVEGSQYDGCVIDESCDQKPGAFARSVRPALSHRNGWCWRIGVPKRFGCGAAEFRTTWQSYLSGSLGAAYEAYTWPSQDILSPDEIRDVARELDQKDFDEQYGAIWQGTSGLVFYAFDEALNVMSGVRDYRYDPSKPLIIGSDFNVDPMSWVIGQQKDLPRDKSISIIDEVFVRNTNTKACLDLLNVKYNTPKPHESGWLFFGDATSKARKTSASSSDYAQIQNDARFLHKKILYPKANPARMDRFAACNAAFCNALGDRRLFVSPRCKNLITDLTSRAYVPGQTDVDDHDDIGHITDALSYIIVRVWPVLPTVDGVPSVLVGAT